MAGSPADIPPVEVSDPLENGLRIMARIIARDIVAKRALARMQKPKDREINNFDQPRTDEKD